MNTMDKSKIIKVCKVNIYFAIRTHIKNGRANTNILVRTEIIFFVLNPAALKI